MILDEFDVPGVIDCVETEKKWDQGGIVAKEQHPEAGNHQEQGPHLTPRKSAVS